MAPVQFYGLGSTVSRLNSHYDDAVYLLTLSSQIFLVISSTSKELKAELNLKPPNGLEHSTSVLEIEDLNNQAIFTK